MSRPIFPKTASMPKKINFTFQVNQKEELLQVLGLSPDLPIKEKNLIFGGIAEAISCFKATANGHSSTTVANTKYLLRCLLKEKGKLYSKAIEHLAYGENFRTSNGTDYKTDTILGPLAKAVSLGDARSKETLMHKAQERLDELDQQDRIEASTEPFKYFCGILREIFNSLASLEKRTGKKKTVLRNCGKFAKIIFDIADIETSDFESQPGRLYEYLRTDVSFIAE